MQFGWRRREGGCKYSDVQSAPGRWNRCDDELRRDGKVLEDCPIPVVLVDRKLDGFGEHAFIEADNYKGGCLAAEHLVKCGCKNIVCMKEPTGYSSGRRRYEGYVDVCKK